MTSAERFLELTTELESACQHAPQLLAALGPSMSIGELYRTKALVDRLQSIFADAYSGKLPKPLGRIETRESKGTPELSERLR
jgi:hypothetical protein